MPEPIVPPGAEQLVVRQHERLRCEVAARALVAAESAERVVLTGDGQGGAEVAVTITDCSRGGLGVRSPAFFPKRCRVVVRASDAAGPIEVTLCVQRAALLDRAPTYYLGLSAAGDDAGLARLMALARASVRGVAGEARRA